jgi:hypothetical protein
MSDPVPPWRLKQRVLYFTVGCAFGCVVLLMGSLMFFISWGFPAAFASGFVCSLFLAHLMNEISANDPPPRLDEALARFRSNDDL